MQYDDTNFGDWRQWACWECHQRCYSRCRKTQRRRMVFRWIEGWRSHVIVDVISFFSFWLSWFQLNDKSCSDLESTRNLFDKYKPNKVIHLAAMVGGLFHNMANNLDFLVYLLYIYFFYTFLYWNYNNFFDNK